MTSWIEHHRLAEAAAEEAEAAHRAGGFEGARAAFARAGRHEEDAFRAVEPSKTRTLSVIGVSAVSLYSRAATPAHVTRLASDVLETPGLHGFAGRQIRDMLDGTPMRRPG
ncbi:hypothetical protein [Salinarimonas sp.]|uniref:hypothetical protein n=1 Tax=Salinarimonas sp. TaxID=2766526 RepID=UPI0032D92BF7